MTKTQLLTTFLCGSIAIGCTSQPEPGSPEEHEEITENLVLAGFPADSITIEDGEVIVGGDAHVTLEASREMIAGDDEAAEGGASEEQYRTYNLVGLTRRVICIDGRKLTGKFSTALNAAITNYNALPLSFNMRRITTNRSGCNAEIVASMRSGTTSSAGFPSGGDPYGKIRIASGIGSYPASTIEHVITHELGHAVGLRHSDYYNRSISCGSGGKEGTVWDGAIHIPGTPTTASVGGSLMNACFRSNESGNFTGSDKTALRWLYEY